MTIDTKELRELLRTVNRSPLPWMLATSNSWRRIVDAHDAEVCTPCTQPDGHPDLYFAGGFEGANAQLLTEAVNSLPALLDQIDTQKAMIGALRTNAEYGIKERDAQAAEIARLRQQLEWTEQYAKDSIKVRSRDLDDWVGDMEHIATSSHAALAQEQP